MTVLSQQRFHITLKAYCLQFHIHLTKHITLIYIFALYYELLCIQFTQLDSIRPTLAYFGNTADDRDFVTQVMLWRLPIARR